MSSSLLDVSPLAVFLLDLATRNASGRLAIGGRTLELSSGLIASVRAAAQDERLTQFLIKSGRVSAAALEACEREADSEHKLTQLLMQRGVLGEPELKQARRSLYVDRLTRGLRVASERDERIPPFITAESGSLSLAGFPLVPLLLDALARAAASADAGVVGASLNHRIAWLHGAHEAAAKEWADFGATPPRPAVSTVLAKRPAAASRIAALLRAGFLRVDPPGLAIPSQPPPPGTLPEPAPRIPALSAPKAPARTPADPLAGLGSVRPPRLRLDPGQAHVSVLPLAPTTLPSVPAPSLTLDDPLLPLEQRIAELETSGASGPERARAFCMLADVWRNRFGSIERACRGFREAAAADPTDAGVLRQAALHCHHIGQPELAARYVTGAVLTATLPADRAAGQRLRALIERATGHTETCIEALCEAAADDVDSAEPHEQVALLLLERGDVDGANAHARLAASALPDDARDRALALLVWAWSLKPADAATAYECASLLDAAGRRLGAVAILAETAARSPDRDQRRKLRLAAAERAEAAQRLDLAAELLIDAFDAEPHLDLLYRPLLDDLTAIDFAEYRAVVLEDVATACPDPDRAPWLMAAGRAMLEVEGEHEAAMWLFFETLLAAPRNAEALDLLREHAHSFRELTLLANGLRGAIAALIDEDPAQTKRLLQELAELAEDRLSSTDLALAAWQQMDRLAPERDPEVARALGRLAAHANAQRASLEVAERALAQGSPRERAELSCRVAELLPDLPEHWPRKLQLLNAGVAGGGANTDARAALETLHGLNRDAAALATFLEQQAELSQDRAERARLLSRLAAVHTVREDPTAVAAACESLLAIEPGSRIAIARLLRAGRKLGDARRVAHALSSLPANTAGTATRARMLAQLARAEEQAGLYNDAAQHALDALQADQNAIDAGLLLLRHPRGADPRAVLLGLSALRSTLAASRALLATQMELAEASGDRTTLLEVIETRVRLMPSDPTAHKARVLLLCSSGDPKALLEAATTALAACPCKDVLEAAYHGLDRLEALGCHDAACMLALRIGEALGRVDGALARRAVAAARKSGLSHLLTSALEAVYAAAEASERIAVLLELASHHRACQAHAAEVRALLRVLEENAHDAETLVRLRELFAQGGDTTRLLAVLSLMLDGEDDPSRRHRLLLELATITWQRQHDSDDAEHYIKMAVAENAEDETALRAALGALFAFGESPRWAIERCQAIADSCPPALASHISLWCALTAEQRLGDPELALEIARAAALRWPSYAEPLLVVERLTLASKDADSAMRTYDALIEVASGPHGRRALTYRAGRWLERAGLLEPALQRYEQAFELAPTTGAAFRALSRVAREIKHPERIVPCYERLAEQVREERARFNLLSTAGELCLQELHDYGRGLQLLLRANQLSERFELDDRVLAESRGLAKREPETARAVLERYAEQLTERAASLWNSEDKVLCLLRLGSVSSEDLGRHKQALAAIDEALAIARREGLAVAIANGAERARDAVLARGADTPAPKAKPKQDELIRLICAEPWRTDALRTLYNQLQGHDSPELHVVQTLVAVFDPDVQSRTDLAFPPPKAGLAGMLGEPSEALTLAAMLWDCARAVPRLRSPLSDRGVSERDRIGRITVGPLADAYARAARALGRTDVPVYVMLEDGALPRPIATHPPAVLASRGDLQEPDALLYRMAHALWLAVPAHIIGGVMQPEAARELLLAARLAFDPVMKGTSASNEVKELAKSLWQSVPMREQHRLSEAVRQASSELVYETLRAETRACAARAALLASGSLPAALHALPELESELASLDLSDEGQFADACRTSPALAETIRTALAASVASTNS